MNKYEIMFILKSNEDTAIKKEIEDLKKVITSMKGKITDEKDMGNKKLAYSINKEPSAAYKRVATGGV